MASCREREEQQIRSSLRTLWVQSANENGRSGNQRPCLGKPRQKNNFEAYHRRIQHSVSHDHTCLIVVEIIRSCALTIIATVACMFHRALCISATPAQVFSVFSAQQMMHLVSNSWCEVIRKWIKLNFAHETHLGFQFRQQSGSAMNRFFSPFGYYPYRPLPVLMKDYASGSLTRGPNANSIAHRNIIRMVTNAHHRHFAM